MLCLLPPESGAFANPSPDRPRPWWQLLSVFDHVAGHLGDLPYAPRLWYSALALADEPDELFDAVVVGPSRLLPSLLVPASAVGGAVEFVPPLPPPVMVGMGGGFIERWLDGGGAVGCEDSLAGELQPLLSRDVVGLSAVVSE